MYQAFQWYLHLTLFLSKISISYHFPLVFTCFVLIIPTSWVDYNILKDPILLLYKLMWMIFLNLVLLIAPVTYSLYHLSTFEILSNR